jgi:predicted aspartyl protease
MFRIIFYTLFFSTSLIFSGVAFAEEDTHIDVKALCNNPIALKRFLEKDPSKSNLPKNTLSLLEAANAMFSLNDEKALLLLRQLTKEKTGFEKELWYWLAQAAMREGLYEEAATAFDNYLMLSGQKMNDRALLAHVLQGVPPLEIENYKPSEVPIEKDRFGLMHIKVGFDQVLGDFVLDTGSEFSTISSSLAQKLGLKTVPYNGGMHGLTTTTTVAKLAIADQIKIGDAILKNVMFAVSDNIVPVQLQKKYSYSIDGFLGFSVLGKLERLEFKRKSLKGETAKYTLSFSKSPKQEEFQNLFASGLRYFVYGNLMSKPVEFFLDTGSSNSEAAPWNPLGTSFEKQLAHAEVKKQRHAGLDGVSYLSYKYLSNLPLELAGENITWKKAIVMASKNYKFELPLLGEDLLWTYDGFVLDFGKMQFKFIKNQNSRENETTKKT